MIKTFNKRVLATTILLTILIISSAYSMLLPCTHAQVTTQVSASTAEGLAIINQVAGFNLTYYNATPTLDNANGSYLGVLPAENVRYTLTGLGNTIEIQDTFTNGHLLMMTVLEDTCSTQMPVLPPQVISKFNMSDVIVQMAKTFLLNYQNYSASSFYGQLASTLDNADIATNSTTTTGNINFEINTISGNSTLGNTTTFTWAYTANGVDADCKCVSLSYRNGFLYSFFDSWNLYPIGSTSVNISQQQAESIAMQNAKKFTWTIGSGNDTHVINNFNLTKPMYEQLVFCPAGNGANARSSDPLTLYPMWGIGIGLDKWYPENVYGIYVNIWADTGKISEIQEASSTLGPPANATVATIAESSIPTTNTASNAISSLNTISSPWMLGTFAVIAMISALVWLNRRTFLLLLKLRKLGRLILCLLVASMLSTVVLATPTVNAGGSALIFGNNNQTPNDMYHSLNEVGNQSMIATYIYNLFKSDGYSNPYNAQGAETTPQYFFSLLYGAYYNYPPIATVYFDHGIGLDGVIPKYPDEFHYMLDGSNAVYGNPSGDMFDYQIYNLTQTSKTYPSKNYFCYISTCMSADLNNPSSLEPYYTGSYGSNQGSGLSGEPIGMPYAWTHENVSSTPTNGFMSENGYADPDNGPYCYIGFPWGSAPLAQTTPPLNSNYPNVYYGEFVSDFFYAALSLDDTVNQALNYASGICWGGQSFQNTVLYSGFFPFWPENSTDNSWNSTNPGTCTMTVYGNGNMYLYAGSPDYVSTPSLSDNVPTVGVANTVYDFTASANDPCGYGLTYTFKWGDGSANTVTTNPNNVQHSYSSDGTYTVTVTAKSSTGLTSQSYPVQVTIGNMLTVDAYDYLAYIFDGVYYSLHPSVTVDGNSWGTAPVSKPVTATSHTLTLSSTVSDGFWGGGTAYFDFMEDQNGHGYTNGASVPVTSPLVIYAWYVT